MFVIGYVPVEASTKPPQSVSGRSSAGLRVPALPAVRRHETPRVVPLPGKMHKATHSLPSHDSQWGHIPRYGFGGNVDTSLGVEAAQSGRPSARRSSDYRYSQRHRFLVDKIHQQRLDATRPRSAQN